MSVSVPKLPAEEAVGMPARLMNDSSAISPSRHASFHLNNVTLIPPD